MSKVMSVIVLGVLIAVVPYLGIPGSWRTTILLVSGLGVALLGFLMRGEVLSGGKRGSQEPMPFVENTVRTHLPHEAGTGPAPIQ